MLNKSFLNSVVLKNYDFELYIIKSFYLYAFTGDDARDLYHQPAAGTGGYTHHDCG